MSMNSKMLALVLLALLPPAYGMLNPAAVYCEAMGYTYGTVEGEGGGELGVCEVAPGERVDAWDFLQGEAAQDYSYCARQGYGMKIVGGDPCLKFLTDTCAACVLPDGNEVEVTELMGLDFGEAYCGDGLCGFPENHASCPQDCPSGGSDEYCDAVQDLKCDKDCRGWDDLDCALLQPIVLVIILLVVAVAAVLAWKAMKK